MSVVQSIQDVGPCRKELRIEVPAPAVEAETLRVTQEYGRRAKIPGFRPGKVPAKVVRQRFHEEIDQEVIDRLVPRYWRHAESESGIEPLTQPELAGVEERAAGEPLVFTAQVEVRPEITLGDLTDLELPDPPGEPTEEEVDAALEALRQQAGDWVPVERAAGQGDLVTVAIREAGRGAGEGEPETVDVEVGSPQVWEELSVAVSGLSEGQKGEFSRMDEQEGEVRERSFRFEVRAVKERDLPELDDELAKDLGELETLAELRDAVRHRLTHEKEAERREQRERALLDQLRARHPIALPQGLVGEETERMVREYAENLARQGVDVEHAEIDWRAMAEQARPSADKRVHARLLLDAVARQEELTVDEAELERTLAELARVQSTTSTALRRALDRDGRLGRLRAQLLRSKTLRHLLGEETPGAPDETAAATPEAAGDETAEGNAAAPEDVESATGE